MLLLVLGVALIVAGVVVLCQGASHVEAQPGQPAPETVDLFRPVGGHPRAGVHINATDDLEDM